MGGRNSVPAEYNPHKKHLAVKGQEEYAWWTLDSIQRCADHAKREGLKVVNRRSFVEVFTDLTVIRQGKFLSLPLTVFDYFVDSDQRQVRRLRQSDGAGLFAKSHAVCPAGTAAHAEGESPRSARGAGAVLQRQPHCAAAVQLPALRRG